MTEFFNNKAMEFEAIAVMVLIVGALLSIGRFAMQVFQGTDQHEVYQDFRENFGLSLLSVVDLLSCRLHHAYRSAAPPVIGVARNAWAARAHPGIPAFYPGAGINRSLALAGLTLAAGGLGE